MCDKCRWKDLLETIEDYAASSSDGFGLETLESIEDWVSAHQHATEKQATAVSNIVNARRPGRSEERWR